jgi:hypothetical protein
MKPKYTLFMPAGKINNPSILLYNSIYSLPLHSGGSSTSPIGLNHLNASSSPKSRFLGFGEDGGLFIAIYGFDYNVG